MFVMDILPSALLPWMCAFWHSWACLKTILRLKVFGHFLTVDTFDVDHSQELGSNSPDNDLLILIPNILALQYCFSKLHDMSRRQFFSLFLSYWSCSLFKARVASTMNTYLWASATRDQYLAKVYESSGLRLAWSLHRQLITFYSILTLLSLRLSV